MMGTATNTVTTIPKNPKEFKFVCHRQCQTEKPNVKETASNTKARKSKEGEF